MINIIKRTRAFILIFVLFFTLISPIKAFAAKPGGGGTTTSTIYYTALGDSISAGTDNTSLLIGRSYAFPNQLRDKIAAASPGKKVVLTNKSTPGDTTTDLLNKLNTNYSTQQAVKIANLITICIGGNNVLNAGSDSGYCEILDKNASDGVAQFNTDLPKIIAKIKSLNRKNPKILIMNLYNTYHPLEWGCVIYTDGTREYGYLNSLIKTKYLDKIELTLENLAAYNSNIKIVDTYSAFENPARFYNVTTINLSGTDTTQVIYSPYYASGTTCTDTYTNFYIYPYRPINTPFWRDPHPTSKGHSVLADSHFAVYSGLTR